MSKQIVLAASAECETELKALGFKKVEVWMKDAPGITSEEQKTLGDRELFNMKHPPFMFLTSSWWGMGPG